MPRRKLIIYGNGQMARMFCHFARLEFEVVAFAVDREVLKATQLESLPVVAFDEVARRYPPAEHAMITAVGFGEMNRLRMRKHAEARGMGYAFPNYVHASVVRHADVELGENNVVLDHVALHPGTRLGSGNFICSNASVGHGCRIGDGCWINSGVSIGGETRVGSRTVLGINATLVDNISVAEASFIGANTLVARDTQPGEVYVSASGERFPLSSDAFLEFIGRRA